MSDTRRFSFERGRAAERLDRFLAEVLPELTRSQIKKLIDDGQVAVGEVTAKAGGKLRGGESIEVVIPLPASVETVAEDIPLKVLYEDRHLIVIDKPAGMVVHPAPGHQGGTIVNALLHHCSDLSGIGGELRPGIVHRLDKDTSGVMLATKDDATHNHLARQFRDHTISRRYIALVHGLVQNDTGTVDRPIGRHPTQRKKMSGRSRRGRHAVTRWRVVQRFDRDRLTLVELTLETGRTHQIRVHLSEMNLPIVGDPVYGNPRLARAVLDPELRKHIERLQRQALHARLLGFVHPQTGAYMEFESPLPADFAAILECLEKSYDQGHDPGRAEKLDNTESS